MDYTGQSKQLRNPITNSLHTDDKLNRLTRYIHHEKRLHKSHTPELTGKALGLDAITNELIKHLPEEAHTFIRTLFLIMVKHNYTPTEWCRKSICLLYKPNKKDPHNIFNYRPIALMNGILKILTSILINIYSPWKESRGILSDKADGFRKHKKIYDSMSNHIVM